MPFSLQQIRSFPGATPPSERQSTQRERFPHLRNPVVTLAGHGGENVKSKGVTPCYPIAFPTPTSTRSFKGMFTQP